MRYRLLQAISLGRIGNEQHVTLITQAEVRDRTMVLFNHSD